MINYALVQERAHRLYRDFLSAWVEDKPFFPQSFSAGLPSQDYHELLHATQELITHSREVQGQGYRLEMRTVRLRHLGTQTIPTRIIIERADDLLWLTGKREEFEQFCADVALIRAEVPALEAWLRAQPQQVIRYHGLWPQLLLVCRCFLEHPRPQLYARALSVPVDTKFIERHTGILTRLLRQILPPLAIREDGRTFAQRFGLRESETLIRIRLLDDQFFKRYGLPLTDLSLPLSELARLEVLRGQRCLIVENLLTFQALPSSFPETIVIFGGGFQVTLLEAVTWLKESPLFYWGDLDAQGFQILSALRSSFPKVTAVMMDEETLARFAAFQVQGTPCSVRQLPALSAAEQALLTKLAEENIRLEQERIDWTYACQRLQEQLRP
ncbi:Wadjet anti-phage system protein JetD domain-containing protein [Thermogemmatispora tikiterensis]|uniref:Wadjet protein JetD C-terminal domain-containing protein n=1 Tax=Thermogemmatispora tikiterensis TaxID=1825093 RepID=A0A328VEK9_9CHLR|nr:Wadjet anti-phage system protein JetD domain-containing protein [Thermogemmatispora tikiterensis]RAQ93973.1 hypothetical protein A4R35_00415 [Thermogemmatispora tikiterensis]